MEYNEKYEKSQVKDDKKKTAKDVSDNEVNEIYGSETGLFKGSFKKKKQYKFKDGDWVAMSQAALKNIATIDSEVTEKGRKLQGVDFRVYLYISGVIDYENYLKLATKDIAQGLGLRPQNVSRSLKKLCDYGILLRGERSGQSFTYRLNPNVGFKGKAKNHKDAVEEMASRAINDSKPNLSIVK